MISAKEAAEISYENKVANTNAVLKPIEQKIKLAANKGLNGTIIYHIPSLSIRTKLESLGYKLDTQYNQKENRYWTNITW